MFKGFRVPDWAQCQNRGGWDLDVHSRHAWENAMHDLNSEWTPMQFAGDRLDPNVIQWFRIEQIWKGNSNRLFYNEVPMPTWLRHRGQIDNKAKELYSFTHADQDAQFVFGYDTETPAGREAFEKEWERVASLVPELISKDDIVYPHEHQKYVSSEPHFRRVWQHYREHVFKVRFAYLVEQGEISSEDADAFTRYVDLNGALSFNLYFWGQHDKLGDLSGDEGYQATVRVMEKLGLDGVHIDFNTSKPHELQFWDQYDYLMELSENDMRK